MMVIYPEDFAEHALRFWQVELEELRSTLWKDGYHLRTVQLYFALKLESNKEKIPRKRQTICRWAVVSYKTNSTPISLSTLPEAFLPFVAASKARSGAPR